MATAFGVFEVRQELAERVFLVDDGSVSGVARSFEIPPEEADVENAWARLTLDLHRARALGDERVARVLDSSIRHGQAFVVWERHGALLAERSGAVLPSVARATVTAVAELMMAAHRQDLAHGALGPWAVSVAERPDDVRIADFGVVRLGSTLPTVAGDIRALGDLLHRLLVGDDAQTEAGRARARPATSELDRLPPGFGDVVRRATSDEYPTMAAFAEALAGLHTLDPTDGGSELDGPGPAPKIGDVVADKYRIVRELGQGGMGSVYEAEHILLPGRLAALKILHPELASDPRIAERFMSEARTSSRVRHPSVVVVEDVIADPRFGPVVVMELLRGESLDVVVRQGPMPVAQVVAMAAQILDALGWAHEHGVVHRDIKPGNLFLAVDDRGEPRAKLLDFGIARSTEEASRTRPGQFVGTRRYASPEQRTDSATVDKQTDLYSFGATLFEMLTGRGLRNTTDGAPASFVDGSLRSAGVPVEVQDVIRRALQTDRKSRFADAGEMKRALLQAAGDVVAAPKSPSTPAAKARWPVYVGAGAFVAVLAGSAFVVLKKPTGLPMDGLRETCRTLGRSLVSQRFPDGTFAATQHNPTSGGDTAQPLSALLHARRGCQALDPADEMAIADALERQKTPLGWDSVGVQDRALYPSTVANAWALMAYALEQPANGVRLRDARRLLLASQQPSGGFPLAAGPNIDTTPTAYPTALALWSLVLAEVADPEPAAVAARERASSWLRQAMAGSDVRSVAGLTEEALYVIALERRLLDAKDAGSDALVQSYARDLLARCSFDGSKCQRQTFANGRVEIQGMSGKKPEVYVTYWFPYAVAAAHLAAEDPAVDADTRKQLRAVADWGARQLVSTAAALTSMANYEVSEYLISVGVLLTPIEPK